MACHGQKVLDLIPTPAPYWLGQCQYKVTGLDRSHGLPAVSLCGNMQNCQMSVLRLFGDSLVADEEVKKPWEIV